MDLPARTAPTATSSDLFNRARLAAEGIPGVAGKGQTTAAITVPIT